VIYLGHATGFRAWPKAKVVRWSNEGPQGGRWGLCQQEADQPLTALARDVDPGVSLIQMSSLIDDSR